ncbi:HAD-IIIC family phosphatase [Marinifilum sp.]|uniref:HAD-IIIC family phosphatase n=1 Tax=Marinifilum sp. TaxID=2033137 RepID=UPI003BAABBBC
MDTIKLIIWDLDDTFWSGTLSEGEISPIQTNIELVKSLTGRGVMNSISSKNDFEKAKEKLQELQVWDYFIFPKINWQPKGQNIQSIIENAQLRAQNVLFLDDNHLNLEEVKFYNQHIWVEDPAFIAKIRGHKSFVGKDDATHERLSHYRVLEKKVKERSNFSDNKEFLRSSKIKLTFLEDFTPNINRVLELIQRTNQINYTKKRIDRDELNKLLSNSNYECKMVKVKDRFGEYGIVGFYALHKPTNTLEHFLFSCRSMNVGVEQFVYAQLEFPKISVVGEVTADLDKWTKPDWIQVRDDWSENLPNSENDKKAIQLLLKGACDLNQMLHYLCYKNIEIQTEFNGVNFNNHPIPQASSVILLQSQSLPKENKSHLIRNLPFFDKDIFSTKVFDEKYDVLVYSLLVDYTMDLYESKNTGELVPYESYSDFIKESKEQFIERCQKHGFRNMNGKFYDNFKNQFTFLGQISPDTFRKNLESLKTKITKPIIFINGAELNSPVDNKSEFGKARERHILMNKALDEFCAKNDNVYLLDVRKIVTETDINHSIRHYKRHVYEEMARELIIIIEKIHQLRFEKNVFKYTFNKASQFLYYYIKELVR